MFNISESQYVTTGKTLKEYPKRVKISNEAYHSHEAVGSTNLKHILRSPAHYLETKKNPSEQSPAMVLGSAIHTMILEPELFKKEYTVMPEFSGTGSRAAKEDWLLKNHGKIALKPDQVATAQLVAGAVAQHKTASQLLSSGHAEEAYFWIDPETDILCKCKPDFLREGHIIVDVKSTIDASFNSFQKAIANFNYHLSAAFYLDGVSAVTGDTYDTFVILAVEKDAPFAMACYVLDEATIEAGRVEYRNALTKLKQCIETKSWPDYPDTIQPINLPSWAWPKDDMI